MTVCVHDRECVLGEIEDDVCVVSDAGLMAESVWRAIPDHYPNVVADAFVVMPNHVHGIVVLTGTNVGVWRAKPCFSWMA